MVCQRPFCQLIRNDTARSSATLYRKRKLQERGCLQSLHNPGHQDAVKDTQDSYASLTLQAEVAAE